jgi:hypothetical protein
MNIITWGWRVLAACALAGNAAAQGFVTVADSADGGYGAALSVFYVVQAVDGHEVPNALKASLQASHLRGAQMRVVQVERPVPTGRPVKLELRGTYSNPAPGVMLFRSLFGSGIPDVVGTVAVELQPGKRYRVNGTLDAFRKAVWIEDAATGLAVQGSQVEQPVDATLLKAMEGAHYTTTNLRYDGDWISDMQQPQLPFVPAGSRLKVVSFGSNKADILIDGRKMRIGVDYARKEESIQAFIARVTAVEDPKATHATWPERVRTAVRAGRVMPGMTREQVLAALGRPRLDQLRDLTADDWPYTADQEELFVVFGADGRVREVDASRKVRAMVLMPPEEPQAIAASAGSAPPPATAGAQPASNPAATPSSAEPTAAASAATR